MTKQEEISQRIKEILIKPLKVPYQMDAAEMMVQGAINQAGEILSYLHKEGAMINVKCPNCEWSQFGDEAVGMTPCFYCNSTGYIVEPLIKES